jgi:hypothetical protein
MAAAAADMAAAAVSEAAAAVSEAAAAVSEAAAASPTAASEAAAEAAAAAGEAAAAAAGAGAGAAAACRGEVATSARLERLPITLTAGLITFDLANGVIFAALPTRMRASGVRRAAEWVEAYRETPRSEKPSASWMTEPWQPENTPCTGVRSCGEDARTDLMTGDTETPS